MAIAVVQSVKTVVTSSANATAVLTSVTAGNLILCYLAAFPGSTVTATCTDSVSNTYTQLFGQQDTTTGMMVFGWYAKNVTGGTLTVTADPAGASSDITIVAIEVSGLDTVTPLDQNATPARGNSTAPSVAVTTSTANEGYFGMFSHDGTDRTLTEAGGWTLISEDEGGSTHMPISVIWKTAAAGTITASWTVGTGAVNWVAGLSSFKEAAGVAALPFRPRRVPQAVKRASSF